MQNILKAHSLYLRNQEIIEAKKRMFSGFFGARFPGQHGNIRKMDLSEEKICAYSYFIGAESKNFRLFLNACEAKCGHEEQLAHKALSNFGNSVFSTQYNEIIFSHVAQNSLNALLLRQGVPYLAVLQLELPFCAALCSWGSDFSGSNYGAEKGERSIDYSFDVKLAGQKVGSVLFHSVFVLEGEEVMEMNPSAVSLVYISSTERRSDAKFMDLSVSLDGTHARRTGEGRPQDLVEALSRNLLAIDFFAFTDELRRGIVMEFDGYPPEVARANFNSLPPSAFSFSAFSYPDQKDALVEFGSVIHATLGDSGYYLKIVMPKNYAVPLGGAEHAFDRAFQGAAFLLDKDNMPVIDLQERYPLREHPLANVIKN